MPSTFNVEYVAKAVWILANGLVGGNFNTNCYYGAGGGSGGSISIIAAVIVQEGASVTEAVGGAGEAMGQGGQDKSLTTRWELTVPPTASITLAISWTTTASIDGHASHTASTNAS